MHMVAQSESSICVTVEDNIFSHRSFLSISFICDFCFVFVVGRIKAAGKDTYIYVCYTHICIEFMAASLMPLLLTPAAVWSAVAYIQTCVC